MKKSGRFDGLKPGTRVAQPRNAFAAMKGSALQPASQIGKDPRTTGAGFTPNLKPKGPFSRVSSSTWSPPSRAVGRSTDRWTYPASILEYNSRTNTYRYTRVAAHLLSLVSGVNSAMIRSATVQMRQPLQFTPAYSAMDGGGAMTLGSPSRKTITFTENYFARSGYDIVSYGENVRSWLSLSAHEVGHLPQIDREGSSLAYISAFIKQYLFSGGHDGASYEKEADAGRIHFKGFYEFVYDKYGYQALEKLLASRQLSDDIKIERLTWWWNEYKNPK